MLCTMTMRLVCVAFAQTGESGKPLMSFDCSIPRHQGVRGGIVPPLLVVRPTAERVLGRHPVVSEQQVSVFSG
jgi:hypothetical protein